jgi:NAD(P)-dependent dehydrogenase (short-subunit alcohol dehydrogenase family)
MTNLQGASIIVVGATGGLGRHIARKLADAGANLTLSARTMTALEGLGIRGTFVPGDLADANFPRTLVATAVMAHGRLDGIINAAGVVAFGPAAEIDHETLDTLWQVNAAGPIRLLSAAAETLAESAKDGGQPFVVTLSGVVSESPTNGLGAYSAVKSALAAYHQVAARELRRQKIRVIDARPGHTETELSRHPVAGQTPKFPTGYLPEAVAQRIVEAIAGDEKDLPSTAFTDIPAAPSETVPVEKMPVDDTAHPATRMAAEMSLEVSTPATGQSAATESAASGASPTSAASPASVGSPPAPSSNP